MAAQLGMREGKFRRLNDLEKGAPIEAGVNYFTQRKRGRAEDAETHVVRAGESLWHVAQRYGIRLQRLEYLNRLKENEIRPGMVLNLRKRRGKNEAIRTQNVPADNRPAAPRQAAPAQPGPAPRPATSTPPPARTESPANGRTTHTVQQGDTLFGISRQYGISVEALKSWNGIGADNVIRVGQRLIVSAP
ncbi:peptidoglycan-binding lysin domain-containing protein [Nitritalea halalkaliphila LW7]|uniref:Peptidoglycan-binding lysin domain-containing protein n=1 Tax=Nitritalea halalkaliphila LW7 TaxID=1189621 RepID=I5C0S2_9BACT|nr:LysM peptidoglycan-binding domain-containing protein [Nitritalea halalkaliphila]EIM75424.1 peptidoglycan-binding lysin domain-containing protein [Nitritalea halalkaliphila LW7]